VLSAVVTPDGRDQGRADGFGYKIYIFNRLSRWESQIGRVVGSKCSFSC